MKLILNTPITEEEIRKLKIGDIFYVSGEMITARDEAHKKALESISKGIKIPVSFEGKALYHCGPVVKRTDGKWQVIAAGPTTSTRLEMFEAEFIRNFGVRVIIGKGGMGDMTAEACKKYGCVYAAFTGGAALIAASAIKRVKRVEWLDLGMPEALWVFEVKDFGPLVVAIDTNGENLFKGVISNSRKNLEEVLKEYE